MMISTGLQYRAIFDAICTSYHIGLGFKNELDLEYKKYYRCQTIHEVLN